jgi:hypothetical protein
MSNIKNSTIIAALDALDVKSLSAPAAAFRLGLVATNGNAEQRRTAISILAAAAGAAAAALDVVDIDDDEAVDEHSGTLSDAADALVIASGFDPGPAWNLLLHEVADDPALWGAAVLDLGWADTDADPAAISARYGREAMMAAFALRVIDAFVDDARVATDSVIATIAARRADGETASYAEALRIEEYVNYGALRLSADNTIEVDLDAPAVRIRNHKDETLWSVTLTDELGRWCICTSIANLDGALIARDALLARLPIAYRTRLG